MSKKSRKLIRSTAVADLDVAGAARPADDAAPSPFAEYDRYAGRDWVMAFVDDVEPEIVDEAAPVPVDFDLDAYAARSFGTFQEEPAHVVLRFLPAAAAEARRTVFHPSQRLLDLDDGGVEVSFTAGGLLEMAHHLFTWGDNVEILAPEALRRLMIGELERALARHRGQDPRPTPPV